KQWRHKSVDQLMQELNTLQAMGAKEFQFTDSDFLGPNPHKVEDLAIYQDFARRKIAEGNTMTFFAYFRISSIFCEKDTPEVREAKIETVRLLKQAGLRVVEIGIDSGSVAQNRRFNKGTTKKEAREAVRILEEVGIKSIKVGMVLFDPFMSFEELLEGMSFVREAGLRDYIHFPFTRLTFYEGTPITQLASSLGILSEERNIMLSFTAAVFLDQRVGRLSRVFDAWHRENKPLIFGIQEIRREMAADKDTRKRIHAILAELRQQYYFFLDSIVTSCVQRGVSGIEEALVENLFLRSHLLNRLITDLEHWRFEPICEKAYALAAEAYHSDILMVKVLRDSASGKYLDWNVYRSSLSADQELSQEAIESVLRKTLARVSELISWRNPRLCVPNPNAGEVRKQVYYRLDQMSEDAAILIGRNKGLVKDYLRSFTNAEKGMKLLWALDRRLWNVDSKKEVPLLSQMELETALKYLLLLSWEIESGNNDLLFVDSYNEQNVKDLAGLKRAIDFCFNELDVNKKSSIQAKKLFMSVQINEFDIENMPRVYNSGSLEPFWGELDRDGQLTSRGLEIPEISRLELNKGVFNPVLKYQMAGLLAKTMPSVLGADVLDVGSGVGILGILAALRGARKTIMVDSNPVACEYSLRNAKTFGVRHITDVRFITEATEGRFGNVIKNGEKFDLIICNPPWGEGTMIGELGKAFSDPRQIFLQYFFKVAPTLLKENGKIVLGYSSRNDYGERTLIDLIDSFRGIVDYEWQVIGSLEVTRPLYSEICYAVHLRPTLLTSTTSLLLGALVRTQKRQSSSPVTAGKLRELSPSRFLKKLRVHRIPISRLCPLDRFQIRWVPSKGLRIIKIVSSISLFVKLI
ncbi:MAG: methyltransferase, partial [Candidatus Omnitrophica bacterium]|nr:methyltransferase [Candidatus Omnitrophota bacterium]